MTDFYLKEECKSIEQSIPDFLEGKLPYDKVKRLYEHLEHCEDCREELEINFLMTEGLRRAESGEVFDLKADLDKMLLQSKQKFIRHEKMRTLMQASGVAVIFVVIIAVLIVFF